MSGTSRSLTLPSRSHTDSGALRRVGIELEMSGLDVDLAAKVCADHLACRVEQSSRYERTLIGDDAGAWRVELDFDLLRQMGREQRSAFGLADELRTSVEELLKWATEDVIPLELISPPLPLTRLAEFDCLISQLRAAGAKGTSINMISAFGMQFNIDPPNLQAQTITAYLKAFLCLYGWLYLRANINLTRRLTSFAAPFPPTYVRQIIDPRYWPDQQQLIADYLDASPTRNRALDMLPLFKHLNAAQVLAVTSDPLIKPRPALHYRLPDSLVDRPGWGISVAWGDWLEVEYLAADTDRLNACCRAYCEHLNLGLGRLLEDWPAQIRSQWLSCH